MCNKADRTVFSKGLIYSVFDNCCFKLVNARFSGITKKAVKAL